MPVYYPNAHAYLRVVFDGFGGDDTQPHVIQLQPLDFTVQLNSYREADTFDITFNGAKFPLSPDLIRNAAVDIYLYQTDKLSGRQDNSPPLIAGLIDNCTYQKGSDGRVFHATGRDYTAIMLDKPWPPNERIPLGGTLEQVVTKLVDKAQTRFISEADRKARGIREEDIPRSKLLTVKFLGEPVEGDTPKVVRVDKSVTQKRVRTAAPPVKATSKSKKKGIPVSSGKNYWDVIYGLCLSYGYICFVRGTEVVITKPHVLNDDAQARVRKLVYGRNLRELAAERKMGKTTTPQVVVTSYNSKDRTRLEAKWPSDKDYKGKQTGVGTFREEFRRYTLHGINDLRILQDYATSMYQNLARGESRVRWATKALKDVEGKDLLTLRAGDAFVVDFSDFKDEELLALSIDERRWRLEGLGYSTQVSAVIASNYDQLKRIRQPLYLDEMTLRYSARDGVELAGQGINFVSVKRDDKR